VKVCLGRVEASDAVPAPQFEELRAGQRPGSYEASFGVGLFNSEVHLRQNVLGRLHHGSLVGVGKADRSHFDIASLLPATAPKKQHARKEQRQY
jgi:hypothetical protein